LPVFAEMLSCYNGLSLGGAEFSAEFVCPVGGVWGQFQQI